MTADCKPKIPNNKKHLRSIRSFVRREGRMTQAQQRAMAEFWPLYGVDITTKILDFKTLFKQPGPVVLEIGFGNGESLLQMASASPKQNFLGIEVHRPGVGHLLKVLNEQQIDNVRVICHDAVEVLNTAIAENTLDRVQIFFPDPWPKKRHHKRRLIQTHFVSLLASRLKPGGILHVATDWQDYAEQIIEVMHNHPDFSETSSPGGCQARLGYRPETKFELRGLRLGHPVCDLIYQRSWR